MLRYPFLSTIVMMFVLYTICYISLIVSYTYGMYFTIAIAIFYGILSVYLLFLGFRTKSEFWKNFLGLASGLCWWAMYGEALETLQFDFHIQTGIDIFYGNLFFLIFLGVMLWLTIFYKKAIQDSTLLQLINFVYLNWIGHVILIFIYYHPIFGGKTIEAGIHTPTFTVWSYPRIASAFIFMVLLFITLILMTYIIIKKAKDMKMKVGAGMWFVLLAWSIFEINKKMFRFL